MDTVSQIPQQAPTQIIIFGGGGDLAQRKLFPALLDLFVHKKLPDHFSILGLARTMRTNHEYQQLVIDSLKKYATGYTDTDIMSFCSHFSYVAGAFDDANAYAQLNKSIETFAQEVAMCTNRLFYLAVPPEYYEVIFKNLAAAKLTNDCDVGTGWARVLVEKPFGRDLQTAQALDTLLGSLFKEAQIFRIDHYLAKEAVQNILSFRFANTLLRSSWNAESITHVRIVMHEALDVSNRGSFYDGVGTLRDVGQNHLLQLLALIAMEEPTEFTADAIRAQRACVLEELIPFTPETIRTQIVRAQYEGYTATTGVSATSTTETYFALKAFINNDRWRNVPFFIEAGKGMAENKVYIEVFFKDVNTGPFQADPTQTKANKLIINISPEQTTQITLNAKVPGFGYQLEEQTFNISSLDSKKEITAYEKVLLDCIDGDQTLFTQTKEVLASWRFTTSILDIWDAITLQTYPKGSHSPAHTLLPIYSE